jgi:hypothetical protein
MPMKISNMDFDASKRFFRILWGVQKKRIIREMEQQGLKYPEESDPLLFLDQRPGETKSQAFSGLKQAIQDTLHDMYEVSIAELKEIDELLKKERLPPLSEVRNTLWNEIPKIMKRGKIKNDTEFYLIKEKAIDLGSKDFSERERESLNRLIEEYEFGRK